MTDDEKIGGVALGSLVSAYIKVRDKRNKLKQEFTDRDTKLQAKQDALKKALLEYCKTQGVTSVRTTEGLFYRTMKKRYWTRDWESMHKFIMDHNVPEFFEKRLNQGVVAQFLEDHPDEAPPGLNVDTEYNIGVRKK